MRAILSLAGTTQGFASVARETSQAHNRCRRAPTAECSDSSERGESSAASRSRSSVCPEEGSASCSNTTRCQNLKIIKMHRSSFTTDFRRKPMFNEFIDKFPAGFSLNKDSTYSFQLSRRSPTELDSSGLVHPQHSTVTFSLQKSYLKAKTQLKTPTKSNCFLQNSPRSTPSKVMKTSSAMGAALSRKDFGVLHKTGIGMDFTHKGSLQSTIYWHQEVFLPW